MKFGFVDGHRQVWPVRVMCAVLGLSSSGYYAWRGRPESPRSVANRELTENIRLIHAESSGCYGSPRVHATLRRHGRRVGRSRVERLMRRAGLRGLAALPRRARTTNSRHGYPIAPNRLARNFEAAAPNQVWLADLTYIPTGEGWLYLAAILDMHTRKIVGWSMRQTLHTEIALDALNMAVERQRPRDWADPSFGSRDPICSRNLPLGSRPIRHHPVDESQGRLLGQCPDGELLPHPQSRACPSPRLRNPRLGPARSVRIHRGLLQSPSPALVTGLYQPRRGRTQSGLTPSTLRGKIKHLKARLEMRLADFATLRIIKHQGRGDQLPRHSHRI